MIKYLICQTALFKGGFFGAMGPQYQFWDEAYFGRLHFVADSFMFNIIHFLMS